MESKSAMVLLARSNGLERYKVSSCGFYAIDGGFWLKSLARSQLQPRSNAEAETGGFTALMPAITCLKSVGRRCGLLAAAIDTLNQLHIQTQRLQLTNQHIERLRHARFNGGLALHNGLIDLGAAKDIV